MNRVRLAQAAVLLLAATSLTVGMASPAAAALTNVTVISDTSDYDDIFFKSALVTCPVGQAVVGLGWSTNPKRSELRLQYLKRGTERSAMVMVVADDNYDWEWSATVYATCADTPPGLSVTSFTTTASADTDQTASVSCSGTKKPLAIGVEHSNTDGQVVISDINPTLTGGYARAYAQESGVDGDWWLRVYVFCAEPPTGWFLDTDSEPADYPAHTDYLACPSGKKVISAGVDLDGEGGEVVLHSLRPLVYLGQYAYASALEDVTGASNTWTMTIAVICVT